MVALIGVGLAGQKYLFVLSLVRGWLVRAYVASVQTAGDAVAHMLVKVKSHRDRAFYFAKPVPMAQGRRRAGAADVLFVLANLGQDRLTIVKVIRSAACTFASVNCGRLPVIWSGVMPWISANA